DLSSNLPEAVKAFCREHPLLAKVDVLDPRSPERYVLVFDGLDELSKQGRVGVELASDFFRQVQSLVEVRNQADATARLLVLLCGRPVAVSSTKAEDRQEGQVLHVLPYDLTEGQLQEAEWTDPEKVLQRNNRDQRDEWWRGYGVATGQELAGIP